MLIVDWLTDARQPYERTHGRTANSLLRWLAWQADDNPDDLLNIFKETGDLRTTVQGYVPSRRPSSMPCDALESYFPMNHPAHCEVFARLLYNDLSPEEAGWAACLAYNRMPETVLIVSRSEIKRRKGLTFAGRGITRPDTHEVVLYATRVFLDKNGGYGSVTLKGIDTEVDPEESWIDMGKTTGSLPGHIDFDAHIRVKRQILARRPYCVLNPVRVRIGCKEIKLNRFQVPRPYGSHIIEWDVKEPVATIADLAALL
jgi:hypothetical protein